MADDNEKILLMTLYAYKDRVFLEDEKKALGEIIQFLEETPWPCCFERSWLAGHITGSACVMTAGGDSILLTHHRKLGGWFQLGGHSDGHPLTWEVAYREAQEESGLTRLQWGTDQGTVINGRSVPMPFDVDTHLIPARGAEPAHVHYDIRYLLVADPREELVVSHESNALAWVPLQEIKRYSQEPSLLRMVGKIQSLPSF